MGEILILAVIFAVIAVILKANGVEKPFNDASIDKFIEENPDSKLAKFLKD